MVGGCGEVWASDKATYALVVLASRSTKEGMYVDGDTPMTYTEAMKEEEIWGQAMKKEIGGLKEMIGVWRLVPKLAGANIVGIKSNRHTPGNLTRRATGNRWLGSLKRDFTRYQASITSRHTPQSYGSNP